MNHRPLKRLGQNFLIDKNIVRKIVRLIEPHPGEVLIEIGPGKGALTEELIQAGSDLIAIEIDPVLCSSLRSTFAHYSNFQLIEGDALKLDWSQLLPEGKSCKIVGNIPYNITSPLLFKIFALNWKVERVVLMVQKEIALRLCARPRTKEYGILTVQAAFYGRVVIGFHISPHVFRPEPRVWSSVIIFHPHRQLPPPQFQAAFQQVVRTAFNQRRKTLKNALESLLPADFKDCPIDLNQRAEALTCADFQILTNYLWKEGRLEPYSQLLSRETK